MNLLFPHRVCRPCQGHAPQAGARCPAQPQMHGPRPVAARVPGARQALPGGLEGARRRVQGLQEPRAAYPRRVLGRGAGEGAQLVPPPGRGAGRAGLADGRLLRGRAQPLLHGPAAALPHGPVGGGEQHPPRGRVEHLEGLRRAVRAGDARLRRHDGRAAERSQLAGSAAVPGRGEGQRLLREADRPLRHPARRGRSAGGPRSRRQAHRRRDDPLCLSQLRGRARPRHRGGERARARRRADGGHAGCRGTDPGEGARAPHRRCRGAPRRSSASTTSCWRPARWKRTCRRTTARCAPCMPRRCWPQRPPQPQVSKVFPFSPRERVVTRVDQARQRAPGGRGAGVGQDHPAARAVGAGNRTARQPRRLRRSPTTTASPVRPCCMSCRRTQTVEPPHMPLRARAGLADRLERVEASPPRSQPRRDENDAEAGRRSGGRAGASISRPTTTSWTVPRSAPRPPSVCIPTAS